MTKNIALEEKEQENQSTDLPDEIRSSIPYEIRNLESQETDQEELMRIAEFEKDPAGFSNILEKERLEQLAQEKKKLNSILQSLQRNERGDAELFVEKFRKKYVFDCSEGGNGEFYVWNGTYWQIDHERQRYKDMEEIARLYEWASLQSVEKNLQDLLIKRASSLRSSRRCTSVFVFVASDIPFKGEWDVCPNMLPCKNGLVDLSTGEIFSHNPDRFIRRVCPTNYDPLIKSDRFNKFLDDITCGNNELNQFLSRCFGAALLGDAKEEKVFYLYGEQGRNGKGTLLQAIERALGKIAHTFPSEMLLQQRNPPSSSSPSPELANLQGVRIAIFSEINKGRKIDAAKVKNLSGRDTIPCRRLYSNVDLSIKPTHTMFIQTNYKPEAPSDDQALWTRNYLIPFNAHFVENPQASNERLIDPQLKEKLFKSPESVLSWLVEGCKKYQIQGLNIPQVVIDETENYRKENDGIGQFIEEKCVEGKEFSCEPSKIRDEIQKYCRDSGFNVPNEREIKSYLTNRCGEQERTGARRWWRGISIKPDCDSL